MTSQAARALALSLVLCASGGRAAHAVSCTATPTGAAFGNYDPSSPVPTDTSGTVTISCSAAVVASTPVTVSLSSGGSGSVSQRRMASGQSSLLYQLYADAARTVVWGDGSGGSSPVSGSVVTLVNGVLGTGSLSMTVYGRIPGRQLATPASYADTILVTVAY
jgi:spore coat protein U-like protein